MSKFTPGSLSDLPTVTQCPSCDGTTGARLASSTGEADYFCEESAIEDLVRREVLYALPHGKSSIALYVGCGDTFAYACSDCEPVAWDELLPLYRAAQKKMGVIAWVVAKRKSRPIDPVVKMLKDADLWTEEMEMYPRDNTPEGARASASRWRAAAEEWRKIAAHCDEVKARAEEWADAREAELAESTR